MTINSNYERILSVERTARQPNTNLKGDTMTHKEYNGWTNYETWLVNVWLTNDAVLENEYRRTCRQSRNAYAAQEGLKDLVEQLLPQIDGFAADLMNAALSEVNWYELAESMVDYDSEDEDEDE